MNIEDFKTNLDSQIKINNNNENIINILKTYSELLKTKVKYEEYNSILELFEYKFTIVSDDIIEEENISFEYEYEISHGEDIYLRLGFEKELFEEDIDFLESKLLKYLIEKKLNTHIEKHTNNEHYY